MNAIMIMCHKNLMQVKRLIEKCKSADSKIIVHIDAETPISAHEKLELEQCGGYLTYTSIHGELDTRSLVDIVFIMIDRAKALEKEQGIHFDYYLLLSGQDYLIKPMEYINLQLKNNYPQPYIDCTPYSRSNWIWFKFRRNAALLKYNRWISKRFSPKNPIRKILRLSTLVASKMLELFKQTHFHVLTNHYGLSLYGGSAWWILPDVVIEYINNERNNEYVKKLLETYTPEETFFQVMVMRSPVSDLVKINPINQTAQNCKTWAYFSDEEKPFKGHPYIFSKNEYEKLIQSECWIARKFDVYEDSEIFDLMDSYLDNYE